MGRENPYFGLATRRGKPFGRPCEPFRFAAIAPAHIELSHCWKESRRLNYSQLHVSQRLLKEST
jgi:hypothetical protein